MIILIGQHPDIILKCRRCRKADNVCIKLSFQFQRGIEEDDLRQEADLTILNVIKKFKVEEYETAEHAYASFVNYIKTSLFKTTISEFLCFIKNFFSIFGINISKILFS